MSTADRSNSSSRPGLSSNASKRDNSSSRPDLVSSLSIGGSYSLANIDLKKGGGDSPVIVEKLTSDVFHADNPAMDWCDIGLLIPHETIRLQMTAMTTSVAALPDSLDEKDAWKITLFAEWYCDYFFLSVVDHHDAEEEIYFPWLKSKAEIPDKKYSKSHEELMELMGTLKDLCEETLQKKGLDCSKEIAALKEKVPAFETFMRVHLKEEELTIPQILRDHFTLEEDRQTVEKILQNGGLEMARTFLPGIVLAMREWACQDFNDQFVSSMPPPIKHLLFKYYLPDYLAVVIPMRDAPTLDVEPQLKKVGCCGFCPFPCIL